MDYDKLPIRCRACLSWKHKASECRVFQKRPTRGRHTFARNNPQPEKGKNIVVDEDGFQQVINKKNTRRNIFDKGISLPGIQQSTFGLPGELHTARGGTQAETERLGTPAEPLGGQGAVEVAEVGLPTNRQNPRHSAESSAHDRTLGTLSKVRLNPRHTRLNAPETEVPSGEQEIPQAEDGMQPSSRSGPPREATATMAGKDPPDEGGRGDPTSTML